MKIELLLDSYPRKRPILPKEYEAIYTEEYQLNRKGKTFITKIVSWLEGWMHRKIAQEGKEGSVLEIGAGTLNHLNYEQSKHYDIIEPFQALYEDNPKLAFINNIYSDVSEVPKNAQYDRVISIAVLEHLENLPAIIARTALSLSDSGEAQHAFPSEGSLSWGLAWRFSTGISYRLRTGLNYKVLMRHEHINSAEEIINVLKFFYKKVNIFRFPLPFHHLSFYTYANARHPFRERCEQYLNQFKTNTISK